MQCFLLQRVTILRNLINDSKGSVGFRQIASLESKLKYLSPNDKASCGKWSLKKDVPKLLAFNCKYTSIVGRLFRTTEYGILKLHTGHQVCMANQLIRL